MARVGSVRSSALAGAFAAALLAVSACFLHRSKTTSESAVQATATEIALRVTNHNYLDVVIYVLHDGQRTRVGTVTGSSSTVFFLPPHLLGQGSEIQLLGDPIGSPDFARTETFVVQAGQYIDWTLETDLRRSSVGVY